MSSGVWPKTIALSLLCVLLVITITRTWRFTNKPVDNRILRMQGTPTPKTLISHVQQKEPNKEYHITNLVRKSSNETRNTTRNHFDGTDLISTPVSSSRKYIFSHNFQQFSWPFTSDFFLAKMIDRGAPSPAI